ncbi:hypothetical protein AALP_AAs59244U000100 [Arabis alpina]|uniref:Plastid lipid-associated protein/fibrillin conserved domain-containing protein n=1 Tax=Arabis alpina TaxID=50452 RepID=A0A087FXB8_ARAAL|nr:hypothetical protein AALP_AAs59244U000100 [Arabis alpina]
MDEKHKSFCGGFFEKQRSFRCTERIGDLITQLDSKNLLHLQLDSKNLLHLQLDSKNLLHPQPNTPSPTAALFLLNGKWILAHTSSVGLFPLLVRYKVLFPNGL